MIEALRVESGKFRELLMAGPRSIPMHRMARRISKSLEARCKVSCTDASMLGPKGGAIESSSVRTDRRTSDRRGRPTHTRSVKGSSTWQRGDAGDRGRVLRGDSVAPGVRKADGDRSRSRSRCGSPCIDARDARATGTDRRVTRCYRARRRPGSCTTSPCGVSASPRIDGWHAQATGAARCCRAPTWRHLGNRAFPCGDSARAEVSEDPIHVAVAVATGALVSVTPAGRPRP